MKEECAASTDFVLVQTTVGPDQVNDHDLFENMDDLLESVEVAD